MQRFAIAAIIAVAAVIAEGILPVAAAEPQTWPWKAKTPPDPALGLLTRVDSVAVDVSKSDPPVISVTVKATAPAADYTDLQLAYRLGDPNDLKFEFDARGRPPQKPPANPEPTPVTIDAAYRDAPVAKVKVIEVHAKDNCIGYSVTDNKTIDCVKPKVPAQQPQP